jgi:hypothetical protein
VVFVRKINDKPHLRFCPSLRILNYYFRKTSSAATIFRRLTAKLLESLGLRAKPALGSFAVLRRSSLAMLAQRLRQAQDDNLNVGGKPRLGAAFLT